MRDVAVLNTDRFTMRPLRDADTAALFPTLSDAEQCHYLTRPEFASEEELHGWLTDPNWPGRTWIAVDTSGSVTDSVTDSVFGRFVAHTAHEEGVLEIGYIVCADRQGQGVASECTRALITHLFALPVADGGARKLIAEVDTRNIASVRLLEKFGFTREAHLREHETTHIGLCDVYFYGLLRSEWSGG